MITTNRIRWYHQSLMKSEMLGLVLNQYGSQSQYLTDLQALFAVGDLVKTPGAINRLGHEFLYSFDSTPMPLYLDQAFNTFDEAALKTAEDMWQWVSNRRLGIFWSGGIDSTAAIVALARTNRDWKKQLVVYTSPHAVEQEYPWFYHNMLEDVKVVLKPYQKLTSSDYLKEIFQSNMMFTDGNCGDQCWNSFLLETIPRSMWNQPWVKFFDTDTFRTTVVSDQRDIVAAYIAQQVSKFPVDVETVQDLYYMLSFSHKWDEVRYRTALKSQNYSLILNMESFFQSFFDSFHFQRWSLISTQSRRIISWDQHKQSAKNFIYKFTKDPTYLNKLKIASGPATGQYESIKPHVKTRKIILVTDNGVKTMQGTLLEQSIIRC